MTDRELLELAAKAAGLDLEWCDFWGCMAKNLGVIDGFDRHTCWNPLQDDGDALRLAVKLNIEFACFDDLQKVNAGVWSDDGESWDCMTPYRGDKLAATRRAIVRAAAQMQLDKETA